LFYSLIIADQSVGQAGTDESLAIFQIETQEVNMIIKYNTSVFTPAGWRNEVVTARVEPITAARVKVIEVLDIGGNGNTGYGSRTGAKRQAYHVGGVAKREIGAVKLISKATVLV
jgi:hypothetical protein